MSELEGERNGSYQDLYHSAACGLLRMNFGGTIANANATFCQWLGYPPAGVVDGKRFQDLLVMGSRIFHQTHWLPLLQMQGSVSEVQFEFQHRDGRVIAALVNAQVHGNTLATAEGHSPQGWVDLAVFVATDRRTYERELLLARRNAEELLERVAEREAAFRTLAENSPDVIARFDRSHRYLYLNHLRDGDGRSEALIGKSIDAVGLFAPVAASWDQALEAAFGGESVNLDFPYEGPDGTHYELQAHVVPERNARGEIVTVLTINRDVTALRAQEQSASQRAVLAEQLVGIVSHDLRNPLNAVLLGTHLLRASELAPSLARVVGRISAAAERANRLVADLLDFTQARLGGGLRVERERVDLHGLIAECLEEIRLAHPGRMLQHRTSGEGFGLADRDRIAQVVSNLVNNAVTYGTPDEPVVVTSAVIETSLEVQVQNFGRPIAPEVQAQIFEPFRRGEHSVKLGSRSVGLGLYVVHEVARAHGGRVSVQSSEKDGTTFTVTLPRA